MRLLPFELLPRSGAVFEEICISLKKPAPTRAGFFYFIENRTTKTEKEKGGKP